MSLSIDSILTYTEKKIKIAIVLLKPKPTKCVGSVMNEMFVKNAKV